MEKRSKTDKDKKKQKASLEAIILSIMEKSLKAAMDAALRDLLKDFK